MSLTSEQVLDEPRASGTVLRTVYWNVQTPLSLASLLVCARANMAAPRRTVACLLLLALCALAPVVDAKKKRGVAVHGQMAPAPAPMQAIGRALLQGTKCSAIMTESAC